MKDRTGEVWQLSGQRGVFLVVASSTPACARCLHLEPHHHIAPLSEDVEIGADTVFEASFTAWGMERIA